MTEQRMNQVVAEVLGYEVNEFVPESTGNLWYVLKTPTISHGLAATQEQAWGGIPDFCNDKNSHAPLFEYLDESPLRKVFSHCVQQIVFDRFDTLDTFGVLSAPPVVIVEAFLRAVGRWEEV